MTEPVETEKNLKLTTLPATPGKLEIKVKNIGPAAVVDQLVIDVYIPVDLVDPLIRAATLEAPRKPGGIATLAGVVTAGGGLSVWAGNYPSTVVVDVRVSNNLDQKTGTKLAAPVKMEMGAEFTLSIPITSKAGTQITIAYEYKYGTQRGKPVAGKLEFTPAGADDWKPKVTFTTDPANSTSLKPGETVTISWAITDGEGVSATLRGPLAGGHSELTLSDSSPHFKMKEGSLEIYASGPAIYVLDAEVREPKKKKTVKVVRTLLLDTKRIDHYASLRVSPDRVLPNGEFDILWAVWGVCEVVLRIEGDKTLELKLTAQDLSGFYHGSGTWRVPVPASTLQPGAKQRETVTLKAITDSSLNPKYEYVFVETWKETDKVAYSGKPVGLAMSGPHMALLTTDGLWIANIGTVDQGTNTPRFSKVNAGEAKAWHALTAYEKGFLVLRQTAEKGRMDGLQLVYYKSDGQSQEKPPINLPDFVELLIRKPGAVFDVAALNKRVYVVVELPQAGGSIRSAYSVSFDSSADWEHEPLIERLTNYRLLVFAGALYGLNRDSGHMVRFILPESRDIEEASRAAKAVKNGPSPTRTGLLVPLDGILTVLGLDRPPALKTLSLSDMTNVEDFSLKSESAEEAPEAPAQDLIYNPQKDEWAVCGQGLKIKPGAVAAFRGGSSKRLWVLQPDGQMYTLTGASCDLFTPGYVRRFPSEPLPPALDAKRQLAIKNNSGINFITMDNIHGYDKFSSDALVEIDKPPFRLAHGARETCEISYHQGDPTPVKLRYLVNLSSGPEMYYFLEVSLSGPNLSSVSSVFKRLGEDRAGVVSIHEVPGTLVQHPVDSEIAIAPPKRLKEYARLVICNNSRYDTLILSNRQVKFDNFQDMTIAWDTRPFTLDILPRGARRGELRVEINFALPDGISSTNSWPQKLIHINSENAAGLEVKLAKVLKPGDPPLEVQHRNGKSTFDADTEVNVYVCQIG